MAKQKGGLGRGLNSLLGGDYEAELVVTPAKEQPNTPTPVTPAPAKPKSATPQVRKDQLGEENSIYSNKEDNVTIKGVVERVVDTSASSTAKRTKQTTSTREQGKDTDEVSIDLIEPNPDQPRTSFKKEELEELAESIKRNGLLQPILVRKVGEKFQIIAGERRYQACKLLDMKTVPIRIRDVDDDETIVLALVENIQRSDLNPIEEAYGYRRMIEHGMTQSQVAQAVSKGRSTIANALRLLELPEEAQQLLFEEQITAGHARAILSIPTNEGRIKLTETLINQQLSVRETESLARLMSGKKESKPAEKRPQTPKSYKTVARSLRETLDTDVRVKSVKGKNKIEIIFKDEADLERLFRIITSE